MAELARNTSDSSAQSAQLIAASSAQVATGLKQSIVAVKTLPSLVVREVSRFFFDAVFGRTAPPKGSSTKGSDSNRREGASVGAGVVSLLTGAESRESPSSSNAISNDGAGNNLPIEPMVEQRNKDSDREGSTREQRPETGGARGRSAVPAGRAKSAGDNEAKPENAWGMKQALERINDAISRVTQSDSSNVQETDAPIASDNHHFTVVEVDDQEDGFRKFTMYAEDDELMLEPWQFRFNDSVMQIEVFIRDPKQVPTMMEHAAEFEESLSSTTGLTVVLSFYCPGKTK
jgi:hypothetical protein